MQQKSVATEGRHLKHKLLHVEKNADIDNVHVFTAAFLGKKKFKFLPLNLVSITICGELLEYLSPFSSGQNF